MKILLQKAYTRQKPGIDQSTLTSINMSLCLEFDTLAVEVNVLKYIQKTAQILHNYELYGCMQSLKLLWILIVHALSVSYLHIQSAREPLRDFLLVTHRNTEGFR